jgi:hypothetical protein
MHIISYGIHKKYLLVNKTKGGALHREQIEQGWLPRLLMPSICTEHTQP